MKKYLCCGKINLIIFGVALAMLTGCSGLSAVKPLEYSAQNQSSVIFGTFAQDRKGAQLTGFWLELENLDLGTTQLFAFRNKNPFIAIPVEPGNYRINQFYYAKGGFGGPSVWTPSDFKIIPIPEVWKYIGKPFEVGSGAAVYLGDFYAETGRGKPPPGWDFAFYGVIKNIEQKFDEASKQISISYPAMKFLGVISAHDGS